MVLAVVFITSNSGGLTLFFLVKSLGIFDASDNLLQNSFFFFISVKNNESQIWIKYMKCSEYFSQDALCESVRILSSYSCFFPHF